MPMFCPRCGGEYRDGFYTCAECHVTLVSSLERGGAPTEAAVVPVLDTRSPGLLQEMVDRLEAEDIPYALQAGTALAMLEGSSLFTRSGPEPWRGIVFVPGAHLERSRRILEELRHSPGEGREE